MYLGKVVSTKNFRVFVYDSSGEQKLVESWSEYELAIASGVWFAEIPKKEELKERILSQEDLPRHEHNKSRKR